MRLIESKVTYEVPHWNLCNSDRLDMDGEISTNTCRFCVKTKTETRCVLYDKTLSTEGRLINKVRDCCKATAGYPSTITVESPAPMIPPKDLMKQTIELYSKTVKDLVDQGYPRQIAEQAAKKHILGG